ncbi:MAG: pyruvate, phosphate dikinase [Alphaproteobacteria bacterium]|nr:pyruvate, phosphate dikinase [Alphaproteobacteria bacterium]MCB9796788.1 pyruvate, phosphate dikinase [Alphaproteobacteria bacterium]
MSGKRYVYSFGAGEADGSASDKALLGGKGANLAEMTRMGLPVPPGFTVTTEACNHYFDNERSHPEGMDAQVQEGLAHVEALSGKRFGDPENPLLVSVRSGAPVSMPGMMDTVLNLGLNDVTVEALAKLSGDERFAWDSYRRFLFMFGDVVLRIHTSRFARAAKKALGDVEPGDLDVQGLKTLCAVYQEVIEGATGSFPQDPQAQLRAAIDAVFDSFNTQRARYYRKTHGIPEDCGTAVNVQMMVFGNLGADSATGVAFTREPSSGAHVFFGEWLPQAQGEDVVAGLVTPHALNALRDTSATDTLVERMPVVYAELDALQRKLEGHYRDMQDIEFTIERGTLYLLQTRTGKRSPAAAVRIAVDMVDEGIISEEEALGRIDPKLMEMVLRPVLDPNAKRKVIGSGLPASPGAASGKVVFHAEEAQELHDRGEAVVLVRVETSPEDIQGMTVSEGILTSRGGQTSHAAVVARGMGKPCVVGATEIVVDYERQLFYAGDTVIRRGHWITIDGTTGHIMEGQVPTLPAASDSEAMRKLLTWADTRARLKVRANADTGKDAARARELGAVGIGLCRTEHMFFQPTALRAMRQLILAEDRRTRQRALAQVLPIQRADFAELLREMDGLPVTVRLLDPPLHEFLPSSPEDISTVAEDLSVRPELLKERLRQLHEANPMMGHRGCRLGITSPEIYQAQVRALFEAAVEVQSEGVDVRPEVMIPLVGMPEELERLRGLVEETAEAVLDEHRARIEYRVGTMIELPRACLVADKIAAHADFFSFGTNDLTQMTYGFSRDDMGKFHQSYVHEGIIRFSPLATFDAEGVGQLVRMGVEKGRQGQPALKIGICGEHGGDPTGIRFFHEVGLDYVSCSPYRVPVARLAAAHAALGLLDPAEG